MKKYNLIDVFKQNLQFKPSLFALLTPFFIARRGLYTVMREHSHIVNGKVIDVGCGKKPYRDMFNYSEYIGVDIENQGHSHKNEEIDVYYDGRSLPFSQNHFDIVLCSQVLEHVFEPEKFLNELNRVCKKGGKLILTVPFVWGEHEKPNDATRFSSFGLNYILIKCGFEVLIQKKIVGGINVLFQLWNAKLYAFFKKFGFVGIFITAFLVLPLNLVSILFSISIYSEDDLYLDNFIVAKKIGDN
jgi:SAM-dependent methyltransferase